ncbi:MAG TPA: hypothetical protein VGO86_12345 [Candidatus Dormibacteraeota bacterium]
MFRQGDVLLVPQGQLPDGKAIEPDGGRLVLARGEATGHHHSVAVEDGELIDTAEGVFLRIMTPTPLEHQEHGAITLQPGVYRVLRQREYVPGAIERMVGLLD